MKKWKHSKNQETYTEDKQGFFKKNKTLLILGIGIILLMIGSVLTFFTNSEDQNSLDYNGHSFFLTPTGWNTKINGQDATFEQSPKELESIPAVNFQLPQSKIYLAFNPNETTSESYEIQRLKSFLFFMGKTPVPACIQEEGCSDLPLVKCTDEKQIILLTYGTESKITQDHNCIVLTTDVDPTRVLNRFIYKLLGIMQ